MKLLCSLERRAVCFINYVLFRYDIISVGQITTSPTVLVASTVARIL